jgi:hypothetical protein
VRGTQDVDLAPDPDHGNLNRLATVLEDAGGCVETAQGRLAAARFIASSASARARDRDDLEALEAAHPSEDEPDN